MRVSSSWLSQERNCLSRRCGKEVLHEVFFKLVVAREKLSVEAPWKGVFYESFFKLVVAREKLSVEALWKGVFLLHELSSSWRETVCLG